MISSDIKESIQCICLTAQEIAKQGLTPEIQEKALAILDRALDILQTEII